MKTLLKISLPIVLFSTMVFLTACEDDAPVAQEPQTIVDIAVSNSQFSTLVAALTKAELVTALQGSGPFTVFAPTNDAFAALLTDLGATSLDDLSKEALTPILLNHVISGEFKANDLSTGYFESLSNSGPNDQFIDLFIKTDGGVSVNGESNVTSADIPASNGVIHVVDKVILPNDIVDIAVDNSNFTSLVGALGSADGDLVNVLKGGGPFTVFAPVNSAFESISGVVAGLSSGELADVLKYHVVAGANVLSSTLTNGMMVTTLSGTFTVNISGTSVTLTDESGATVNVIATDVQGKNGVIHVIDKVLLK
ncbi:MAG: fasciclin domain-containing protein [Flammeovirgaceae bacterium]|nr:fasciclin domain-containing protein [Flammeovirgaceae bacterium]